MPGINDKNLNAIQRKFAAAKAAQLPTEYTNPFNSEAIATKARLRAQRPSTPPIFDSPMPCFSLEPNNLDLAHVDLTLAPASLSNSFYVSLSSSPLFFSSAAQANPPSSVESVQEWEVSQSELSVSRQQTLAQGSRVSVLRKLRTLPLSNVSDSLSDSDEIVEIINAWSTTNEVAESEKTAAIEGNMYFAGAAAVALRSRNLRPLALNPAALFYTDTAAATDTPEPQAPRKPFRFETQRNQASAFELAEESSNELPALR